MWKVVLTDVVDHDCLDTLLTLAIFFGTKAEEHDTADKRVTAKEAIRTMVYTHKETFWRDVCILSFVGSRYVGYDDVYVCLLAAALIGDFVTLFLVASLSINGLQD